MDYDTRHGSYTLPSYVPSYGTISTPPTPSQPISQSNIGNVYPVAQNQSVSISTDVAVARWVLVSNVGSVALVICDTQRPFPYGQRLIAGSSLTLYTKNALWASAPPTVRRVNDNVPGLVPAFGYVSVCFAN